LETVQTTVNSWELFHQRCFLGHYFIIEGYLQNKHQIMVSDLHVHARREKPAIYPRRFPVPDDKVDWGIVYGEYSPVYFVAPQVLAQDRTKVSGGWADSENISLVHLPKETAEGPMLLNRNGVPMNPRADGNRRPRSFGKMGC